MVKTSGRVRKISNKTVGKEDFGINRIWAKGEMEMDMVHFRSEQQQQGKKREDCPLRLSRLRDE
jgi:hypothetical protein